MIGHIIALACVFVGTCGLLFVAFLRIHTKFQKRYIVHWEGAEGRRGWFVVKACTIWGAIRVAKKIDADVEKIIKVVRQW